MKAESKPLDARAFGFAAATMAVASTLSHLDLSEISRTLSWGGYFSSLIGWTLAAGVVFWAAAALYNGFAGERAIVASTERVLAAR